jgi:ectoine hydroxylase-related dioxygenase (phytanoyl-CoA dioxygenase family)
LVGGIFGDAELNGLERAFDGIIARRLAAKAQLEATWGGAWRKDFHQPMQLIHTHDLQAYDAAWAKALVHDQFTEALADCLGSPNVQLHHTKAFQKPPENGAAFPMHQDAPYFPHARHSMMAGIIHLSDADAEMGCVCVYPGSHKLGLLPEADSSAHYLDTARWPIAGATPCPARRGEVLLFNYLTVHGSGINRSPRTRKTVLVQVRDPLDKPLNQNHRSHAQGMMLRGINPLSLGQATAEGTLGSGVAEAAPETEGVAGKA